MQRQERLRFASPFVAPSRRLIHVVLAALVAGVLLSPAAAWPEPKPRKLKSGQAPGYPALAKKLEITGTVKAKVYIAPNGLIKRIEAQGHPLLVQAVVDTVKTWEYEKAANGTIDSVSFVFK